MPERAAVASAAPTPVPPPAATPGEPRTMTGWIEAGIGVIVLPITVTVMVLAAPFLWMLASKAAPKA